jgi:hypothetical protein
VTHANGPGPFEVQPSGRCARRFLEPAGIAAVCALAAYCLITSWRKWPDALIDFGRQLYLPWRLSEGAVLQRDVEDYYGPLSQHLHALLFECFGTGMMVLVAANLVVFTGIAATLYVLCRRAWGAGAAVAATATFVTVFAFSQLVGVGNYNYATPYVHETTHGMLVCLLLVLVLHRWVRQPRTLESGVAGLLLGACAVLKPEFLLSGVLVTLAALWIARRERRRVRLRSIAAWTAGVAAPTVAFTLHFARHMPWTDALSAACRAWLNVAATSRYASDASQLVFLGFDRPGEHLVQHVRAAGLACAAFAAIVLVSRWTERRSSRSGRYAVLAVLAGAALWSSWSWIEWFQIGRCLLGVVLVYATFAVADLRRPPPDAADAADADARRARVLLAVLAVAMMARMLLNGRVYQFGFYQAAIAGVLVPAVLVGELPGRAAATAFGRAMVVTASLALLVPGIASLVHRSRSILALKTHAVGSGSDRFYTWPPTMDPMGEMVRAVSAGLREKPAQQTVLVLPAGVIVNYLARHASPLPQTLFFAGTTAGGGEAAIVEELRARPPTWVVLLSLDLREFGVQRYGESDGAGKQILAWVDAHCRVVKELGGDPLDVRQRGCRVLRYDPATGR